MIKYQPHKLEIPSLTLGRPTKCGSLLVSPRPIETNTHTYINKYISMDSSAYKPIWDRLKNEGTVSITANRLLHPRIIKAVIKRKWLDLGYKISIEPRIAVLSHSRNHAILTFYLDIKEHTLDFRLRGPINIGDF